ncbi:MAG: 30S ribosomal protein S20 [Candidatus Kerfeldbacteria bacterium]|nr:30S ribosomal protein S20 [Candidatus Kerfeldbacteria bacterium]
MPIKHAAFKHLRQTKKRTAQNKSVKGRLRSAMKDARAAITAKDKAKAAELVKAAVKVLDKAAQNKVVPKNTASRYKSRLMTALNKI